MNDTALDTMRHSCAHLLAAAVATLRPGTKFGVGPVIENGFYYDVLCPEPIREDELPALESIMRKLRKKKVSFTRQTLPVDQAIAVMKDANQPFKVELLELLQSRGSTKVARDVDDDKAIGTSTSSNGEVEISFYQTGDFVDLCRGPHLNHAGEIGAFALTKLAGAYWRGDENRPQLQRIYGLCYADQAALDQEIDRIEEMKLRDHRRIGKACALFHFDETVGRGLPLWLPNGFILRQELEALARLSEQRAGYQSVATPHIAKASLFEQSGHLPYYRSDMYPPMQVDDDTYYLRPMNCPFHHKIYEAQPHSYRDLPLRLSEYGQVYRYEDSGALNGLMRTRGFCQNDAHIYCRPDQVIDEFLSVIRMHADYYRLFNIAEFRMILALPDLENPNKYVDQHQAWLESADLIRQAMQQQPIPYTEEIGEAAFYGPKIDFVIKSAIGTEYTISTCQLDFMAADRFSLRYRDQDGEDKAPYVIHRAPLGTHERFIAFLIEQYAGAFPAWLCPEQVRIIPIADRHVAFAEKTRDELIAQAAITSTGHVRVNIDSSGERMQKKIRTAQMAKVPYMIVIGDQEAASGELAVRTRCGQQLSFADITTFASHLSQVITTRSEQLTPLDEPAS